MYYLIKTRDELTPFNYGRTRETPAIPFDSLDNARNWIWRLNLQNNTVNPFFPDTVVPWNGGASPTPPR